MFRFANIAASALLLSACAGLWAASAKYTFAYIDGPCPQREEYACDKLCRDEILVFVQEQCSTCDYIIANGGQHYSKCSYYKQYNRYCPGDYPNGPSCTVMLYDHEYTGGAASCINNQCVPL